MDDESNQCPKNVVTAADALSNHEHDGRETKEIKESSNQEGTGMTPGTRRMMMKLVHLPQ